MKAIVYRDYGSPDVLRLEEIEKPVPNDNQLLVKVRAASVNPLDWHYMEGTPYLMRLLEFGLLKPKVTRLGVDYAGHGRSGRQERDAVQARRRGIRRERPAPLPSMCAFSRIEPWR